MNRGLFVLLVALVGNSADAQTSGDRLQSGDCRQALDDLDAHVALATRSGPAGSPPDRDRQTILAEVQMLQRRAALACLGGRTDSAPPSQRFAQPPISVAPVTLGSPARRPAPADGSMVRSKPAPMPVVVTACDASGCWTSEGTRLQRAGPNLIGPSGLCVVQGAALRCP